MAKCSPLKENQAIYFINSLNQKQKRIVRLLCTGDNTQSRVAELVGVTPQYVNPLVKKLLKYNLIRKSEKSPNKRDTWYESSLVLKNYLKNNLSSEEFSSCRVHNIRIKYPYWINEGKLSRDKRTGYFGAQSMRGWRMEKYDIYSYDISIILEVNPKTIVVYPRTGQTIYAKNPEDSYELTLFAIHEAISKFRISQQNYGCNIEIGQPVLISEPHYGFYLHDFWIDGSPKKHGFSGMSEIETKNLEGATALDRGLKKIIEGGREEIRNEIMFKQILERLDAIEGMN